MQGPSFAKGVIKNIFMEQSKKWTGAIISMLSCALTLYWF